MGGQPCRPESPRPGLASIRGLGLAATALVTQSVQRPRGPRCPLCPAHLLLRPEATVLLAGASPSHTPSGLRIPRLKAQAGPTFQGNALSSPNPSPAPTPTDGRVHHSPAGVPAPRSKQEERDKVGGTGAITAAPAQIWAGGHREGLPGLRSDGGSCEARVWGLPLTPAGPSGRRDSKKIPAKLGSRCGGVASRVAPLPLGSALNGGGGGARQKGVLPSRDLGYTPLASPGPAAPWGSGW